MFEAFKVKLENYYLSNNIKKEIPSDLFLYWLIGFGEGDGSFIINKRNELSFILIQGAANKILLDKVHEILFLGHIIKQSSRVYRLIIQKKAEVKLIILLFNGNIVLPSRKIQFSKFISKYNEKNNENEKINYINDNNYPSNETAWLLGFAEAEGCFTVSLLKNSKAYRTRFILSQKGDINLPILSKLILIFQVGYIEGHHVKDNYSFVISSLKNIKNIYSYFDKYLDNFMGIKKDSYLKFKKLNQMFIEGKHLNNNDRVFMMKLASDINSATRKFK